MKQLLLSSLFCMALFAATGQTNFVEVTVTDTALAKADYFVFRVNTSGAEVDYYAQPDTAGMRTDPAGYYRRLETKRAERQKEAIKALEAKLTNAGFATEPAILSDLAYRNYAVNMLSISTRSVEALYALTELLKTEKGMNISLTQIGSSQEDATVLRLQQKLMAKARTKAVALAKQSGKQLSTIISVSDRRNDVVNYQQTNLTALNTFGVARETGAIEKINTSYPITGTLVVKFAWQ